MTSLIRHDITEFNDEFAWLSNFWRHDIELDGVIYPTVEHAYQASKTTPDNRSLFKYGTPGQAKRLGRQIVIRSDWEKVKVEVMKSLIRKKFPPGSKLAEKLIETAPWALIEGNTWNDTFWGVCRGRGSNMLGKILMEHRRNLLRFGG